MKRKLLFLLLILKIYLNFGFKNNKYNIWFSNFERKCPIYSIEKDFLKINLNYHIFDGHDKAFDIWKNHLNHKKHKKLTLLHIDSRKKKFQISLFKKKNKKRF